MSQSPGLAKLRPSRSAGNSQSCLHHHGCLATSSQRGPVAPRSRARCGRVGRRRAPACTEGAHTWRAPHLPAPRGRAAPACWEGAHTWPARTCLLGGGAHLAGAHLPAQRGRAPACTDGARAAPAILLTCRFALRRRRRGCHPASDSRSPGAAGGSRWREPFG